MVKHYAKFVTKKKHLIKTVRFKNLTLYFFDRKILTIKRRNKIKGMI